MSSAGKRERILKCSLEMPSYVSPAGKAEKLIPETLYFADGKQITVSESHPKNPKTGSYNEGGSFFTSRLSTFIQPGYVEECSNQSGSAYYSGPVCGSFPTLTERNNIGYQAVNGKYGDENISNMTKDGATAISQCSPTNPASNLGTTLAETFREGVPSLPGIQSWEARTKILKGLGSEYLNYQFGWAPLKSEVNSVVNTAKHHKEIMTNFHNGEGGNTRRSFHFPSSVSTSSLPASGQWQLSLPRPSSTFVDGTYLPVCQVSLVRETHRWFEGCFTYALPASTDSWGKHIGFGEDAEHLFGLDITPDVLWELTPWSWAVDWFSNAGDVINNVTNFGTAGLVMRYGYMMEESIERVTNEVGGTRWIRKNKKSGKLETTKSSPSKCGFERVTKRRVPANPFGFGIGWEGLSPTQLAITAALGITRLL